MRETTSVSPHLGTIAPVAQSAPDPVEQYPPILTTAGAAELLSIHVEYLRRMVREGRIPAHRFPGGREIRFLRDELIDWVRQQPGYDRSPSAAERPARD
jgi:excisionase family DNA binding protein